MRPFDGSPTSWGSTRASTFPHAGPASYTQITEGVAPALSTGGDTVEAAEAGLKYLEGVVPLGLSDSGAYRVEALVDSVSGIVGNTNPGVGQPTTTMRLRWVDVSSGAQVAGAFDLSAEIVRLLGIGPK